MWDDIIKKFQGFSSKHPQNAERFQSTIDAVKAIKEATTKLEKVYAELVVRKYNLLISGLEIGYEDSDHKKELLSLELEDVQNILLNGRNQEELAIENWPDVLSFDPKSISKLYRKLIKGQESFLLFKFADNQQSSDELSTTRALVLYRDYLEGLLNELQAEPATKRDEPQREQQKTDSLNTELGKYGFFELSMVRQLSEQNQRALVEQISTNGLPYSIAMFDFLGFLKHLKAEHFLSDYKLFKAIAKWFDIGERTVKGNILVLNDHSKENRNRYTADQQKETVQNNYKKLK